MDRKVAELLMKDLLALSEPLNSATALTDQISNKDEQAALRRGIGELMGRIYTDLMIPIIKQYPELDPDRKPPRENA